MVKILQMYIDLAGMQEACFEYGKIGSTVERLNGSTVERLDGSTVERLNGSTVERLDGSTVERLDGSTVERLGCGGMEKWRACVLDQYYVHPKH
jgi:hypothetical protein